MSVLVFYCIQLNCFRWIPPHTLFKGLAGLCYVCYSLRLWWGVKVAYSASSLFVSWLRAYSTHFETWVIWEGFCPLPGIVLQDRPPRSSCFHPVHHARVVRRREPNLTTSRLKPPPAGARCQPEPRGPSWPRAERRGPGWGASWWGGPPSVCAAPGASAGGPPWRSRWWSSRWAVETCFCRQRGKMKMKKTGIGAGSETRRFATWADTHLSPMRTHRSLKRRGLPWPRWALRSRLWRPNSSSWFRLSGSNMWGNSSSPRPGTSSGSCSSGSDSRDPVVQPVGVPSVGSSVDPGVGSSAGLLLQAEGKKPARVV